MVIIGILWLIVNCLIENDYYGGEKNAKQNYDLKWFSDNPFVCLKVLGTFLYPYPSISTITGVRNHISSGLSKELTTVRKSFFNCLRSQLGD